MRMTFVASFLVAAVCLPAPGQQVAFVDLTAPPKTPERSTGTSRFAGGRIYDHPGPAPGTPTMSVKLVRVTTYTEGKATRDAVEVEVTNRGVKEMSVPVGKDYVSSLAAGEQDRQYLSFTVRAGNDPQATVASARAATNRAHPEVVVLHLGESVVFRLPFASSGSGVDRAKSINANLTKVELAASVSVWVVAPDGEDSNVQVGDAIQSENTLLWR